MSSIASRRVPRLYARLANYQRHRLQVSPWMVLALLAWTSLLVPVMGIKGARFGGFAYISMTGIWLAVLAARFFRHREVDPDFELASWWTSIVSVGYLTTTIGTNNSLIVLGPFVIAFAAVMCTRYPAQAIFGLAVLSGGFGSLQALTGFGVGPIVHLILAGLWVALLWRVATKRRHRALWTWPAMGLVALYLLVTLLELPRSETLFIGLRAISVGPWYMLAFPVIAYTGLSMVSYQKIARGFVLVAVAVGGYALLRHFVGPTSAERALAISTGGNYNTVEGTLRNFGSLSTGGDLAGWATCAVPFCLGCALGWTDRWRYIAVLGAGLCLFALVDTKVRTVIPAVLVGVAVTMVIYMLTPAFGPRRLAVAMVSIFTIASVAVVLFAALGSNHTGRYSALLHPKNDDSFSLRTYKWRAAIRDIRAHPAGYGVGSAGFEHARYGRFYLTSNLTIENSYLLIAYQEGFIVMTLFAVMLLALVASLAVRTVSARSRAKATLAVGPIGSLLSFMVIMISSANVEGFPALWTWLLVGLACAQFAFRDPADKPEPAKEPVKLRVPVPA
jgi:hypothetical protein